MENIQNQIVDLSNPELYASKWHIKAINDVSRYLILYGSRGSGKSHCVAQRCVIELLSPKYCCWLLLRKQSNTIIKSMYNLIKSIIVEWGLYEFFEFNKTDKTITCKLTGNTANGLGLDDPDKIKSFVNPTKAWAEEGDAISYSDFMKVDTSLRGSNELQFIISFNPENEQCWINEEFFPSKSTYEKEDGNFIVVKSKRNDTSIYHLNFEMNKYCIEETKTTYRNLKYGRDKNYYLVYCLGLWGGKIEGLVFPNVVYKNWSEYPKEDERKKHGYGMDFGFTNDPTTLTENCIAHGELHIRCLLYETGLTNTYNDSKPDQKSIEGELNRINFNRREKIIADCAEPKSIQDLNNAGFWVDPATKGKDSIEYGLRLMNNYVINVYIKSSEDPLRKEFKNYSYKKDKNGETTNNPIDNWNHAIDGSRYWAIKNLGKKDEERSLITLI